MLLASLQVPDNLPDYQKYYRQMHKVCVGNPPKPKLRSLPSEEGFLLFAMQMPHGRGFITLETDYASVAMPQDSSVI